MKTTEVLQLLDKDVSFIFWTALRDYFPFVFFFQQPST